MCHYQVLTTQEAPVQHHRRTDQETLISRFDKDDLYGRNSLPEMRSHVTNAIMRQRAANETRMIHVAKNGVNDPVTFYHVLDALLVIQPGVLFRTAEFLEYLRFQKTMLSWDAVTVGRVLTDIASGLHEAYGRKPIDYVRRWNGMTYMVHKDAESRVMVLRLLEDMALLGKQMVLAERRGETPLRYVSPLSRCPSLS
jgi:hypothetical protein